MSSGSFSAQYRLGHPKIICFRYFKKQFLDISIQIIFHSFTFENRSIGHDMTSKHSNVNPSSEPWNIAVQYLIPDPRAALQAHHACVYKVFANLMKNACEKRQCLNVSWSYGFSTMCSSCSDVMLYFQSVHCSSYLAVVHSEVFFKIIYYFFGYFDPLK